MCEIPIFDGLSNIQFFLQEYQVHIPSPKRLKTLDVALRAILVRWWVAYKKNIATSETSHRLLVIRFGDDVGGMSYRYYGHTNPKVHMEACVEAWKHRSADEWVHLFVETLDTTPKNWDTETELHRGTKS